MEKIFDFKKEYKNLYSAKEIPVIVEVPKTLYIMVDGLGDPNNNKSYQEAIELLYSVAYAIKMSKMGASLIKGYFDFIVPPLEGLWSINGGSFDFYNRDNWIWTMMIRMPEFVTNEVFNDTITKAKNKKPNLDFSKIRLDYYDEGLCVQQLHIGPYETEPNTIDEMHRIMDDNDLIDDIVSGTRMHHEIYLSDPRKTSSDKLKTIIRHPVIKK